MKINHHHVNRYTVHSKEYRDLIWVYFPFLFGTKTLQPDWMTDLCWDHSPFHAHVRAWLASLSSMAEVPISTPTRLLPWKCVFNWWPTCLEAMTFTLKAAPCAMTVDSCLLIMDFQPFLFSSDEHYTLIKTGEGWQNWSIKRRMSYHSSLNDDKAHPTLPQPASRHPWSQF